MSRPSKFATILLALFVSFHLVFAVAFAIQTPYRKAGTIRSWGPGLPTPDVGAPDERQHANYVRYLLKEHKLPVLVVGAPDAGEEYESHQPPLYYGLAAAAATVTGQTDVESGGFGNVARILNAIIGAVGVAGVFFAVLWATKREDLALVGTAFAALIPMNCALSGAISNDPLLITLISWSFAWSARALGSENEKEINRAMIWAAVFAGLACLTKSTGLVAMVGLSVTLLYLRKQFPITKVAGWMAIGALIASPVWIRNQLIYGDPLAQKVFKAAFAGSPQKAMIVAGIESSNAGGSPEAQYWINWVGYWTSRSYIGVFGVMDIWLNSSGKAGRDTDPNLLYKAIILFVGLAKISFLLYLRNKWKEVPKAVFVGLAISVVTVLLFIGFNMTYFQAQGRYLYPALAPTALVLGLGWVGIFKSQWKAALVVVSLIFGGTTIYALSILSSEFAQRLN